MNVDVIALLNELLYFQNMNISISEVIFRMIKFFCAFYTGLQEFKFDKPGSVTTDKIRKIK